MESNMISTNEKYDYILNPPYVEGAIGEGYVVEKVLQKCSQDERFHISTRCIAASLAYWVGLEDPCIQLVNMYSPMAASFISWCLEIYPPTTSDTLTYQEYYPIAVAALRDVKNDIHIQSSIKYNFEDKWDKYIKKMNNLIIGEFPDMCLIEKNNVYRKYVSNNDENTYFEIQYRFKGNTQTHICECSYIQKGVVKYNIIKKTPKKLYKKLYKII